nr:TonB-dependent receptor plug domain-containing protein [Verrucomicrobiota bacterium]
MAGALNVHRGTIAKIFLGSARLWRAGRHILRRRTSGDLAVANMRTDPVSARAESFLAVEHRNRHAKLVRSPELLLLAFWLLAARLCSAQEAATSTLRAAELEPLSEIEEIVVTATRLAIPADQSPATVSVVTAQEIEQRQIRRVADALREVPGVSIVQTGAPGQLTSVFTRGLRSEHTQVLLDGIPVNQGLQGAFNFSDLTVDNIDRIEVVRGPQSTLYGPRALAGVIQIFTKQGSGAPTGSISAEAGSFGTFRESFSSSGATKQLDYSLGLSRLDTENDRPNNEYRLSNGIANIGWSPNEQLRVSSLFTYSLADTGNPNSIFDPKPRDNFLTERWLIGPHLELKPLAWWEHKLILSYDHERQVNDPNEDFFVGPTRALFKRFTVDYQNNAKLASWLTLTTGAFY